MPGEDGPRDPALECIYETVRYPQPGHLVGEPEAEILGRYRDPRLVPGHVKEGVRIAPSHWEKLGSPYPGTAKVFLQRLLRLVIEE